MGQADNNFSDPANNSQESQHSNTPNTGENEQNSYQAYGYQAPQNGQYYQYPGQAPQQPQQPQQNSQYPAYGQNFNTNIPAQPYYRQPNGYQYPGGHYQYNRNYYPVKPQSSVATAGMIVGIISVLFSWTVIGGIILGVIAVILGIIGLDQTRPDRPFQGRSSAIAGIVTGAIALCVALAMILLIIYSANYSSGSNFYYGTDSDTLNSAYMTTQVLFMNF